MEPFQMRFFVVHYFWSKILIFSLCGCNNSKTNFILQLQEQKSGRRQTQCSRTLCESFCSWPSWCYPLQSFQIRYLVFISDQKSWIFLCVPATKAKWILFLNHRNRKVLGGKHNISVYYVNACASDSCGVVLWNPFKWDFLSFNLFENLVVLLPTTLAKQTLFFNYRNKQNVLEHYVKVCAPDPAGVVLCNPFR